MTFLGSCYTYFMTFLVLALLAWSFRQGFLSASRDEREAQERFIIMLQDRWRTPSYRRTTFLPPPAVVEDVRPPRSATPSTVELPAFVDVTRVDA